MAATAPSSGVRNRSLQSGSGALDPSFDLGQLQEIDGKAAKKVEQHGDDQRLHGGRQQEVMVGEAVEELLGLSRRPLLRCPAASPSWRRRLHALAFGRFRGHVRVDHRAEGFDALGEVDPGLGIGRIAVERAQLLGVAARIAKTIDGAAQGLGGVALRALSAAVFCTTIVFSLAYCSAGGVGALDEWWILASNASTAAGWQRGIDRPRAISRVSERRGDPLSIPAAIFAWRSLMSAMMSFSHLPLPATSTVLSSPGEFRS